MATLNIRIEEHTKTKANKTLSSLGIDMSTAVKMFLNQVIIEKGFPFIPTANKTMIKNRWDKQTAHALKHSKTYATGKDVLSDLV